MAIKQIKRQILCHMYHGTAAHNPAWLQAIYLKRAATLMVRVHLALRAQREQTKIKHAYLGVDRG